MFVKLSTGHMLPLKKRKSGTILIFIFCHANKTKNEILNFKDKNIEMSGSIRKSAILNIFVLLYIF